MTVASEVAAKAQLDCSSLSDGELLRRFRETSLPGGSFHHRDHVRVTWLLLERLPVAEVLAELSTGLRRFAAANGKPELYHETITWAYIFLIAERARREPVASSWVEFEERNPDLMDWAASIVSTLYSPERLNSPLARALFVLPQAALPRDHSSLPTD